MALFEIDGRWWREFNRQLKAAGDDGPEAIKKMWADILEPMRADWARRVPSSRLKKTVKVRRKAHGEIWAGTKSPPKKPAPFWPWLEFGGTIGFEPGPIKPPRQFMERVPNLGGDVRTVRVVRRPFDKEGRYRQPAVDANLDAIAGQFAEAVADIFNKHFVKHV